ncbi:uncharacterized protein LOC144003656 [Festucalex cinctus]
MTTSRGATTTSVETTTMGPSTTTGDTTTGGATTTGDATGTGAATTSEGLMTTSKGSATGVITTRGGTSTALATTTASSNTTGESATTTKGATTEVATTTAGSNTSVVVATTTAGSSTTQVATTTNSMAITASSNTTTLSTTTTTATTTTTTSAQPDRVVVLRAVLLEPYVPELADPSSSQFIGLAQKIFNICDPLYRSKYTTYSRCNVQSFRPATALTRMENTEVDVDILFNNNSTSGELIPSADDVAKTLQEAVADPSNNFNLTFDPQSIQVVGSNTTTIAPTTKGSTTAVETTTAGSNTTRGSTTTSGATTTSGSNTTTATTTTTPAPPDKVVVLVAVFIVPFVQELEDPNSPQFAVLALEIFIIYDTLYKNKYATYSLCVVRRFRRVEARADNTEAVVDILFNNNNNASGEVIPSAEDVAATLQEAANDPNNNFNLTIDSQSIQAFVTTSTDAPTTRSTAAEALTMRRLTFRSAGEEFTTDLLDSSSAAFSSRASIIEGTLKPLYVKEFTSFRTLNVASFSNGSIINNVDLNFASGSVPGNGAIAGVLVNAAPNITAFDVDASFVFVDGQQVSSGVSHKTNLVSASFLVLLSWLLARQQ